MFKEELTTIEEALNTTIGVKTKALFCYEKFKEELTTDNEAFNTTISVKSKTFLLSKV